PGPSRAPARADGRQRGRAARAAPTRSGGTAMSPTAADPARVPGRRRSVTRSVLRGAGVILVVTVFARILGFVRYLVFGASIGAGDVGTAYTTANMLPTVLFEIAAGGVLAAVVVPLIAGLVPEGDPADHVGAGADGPGATGRAAGMPYPVDGEQGAENSLAERTADDGAALADRIVSTLLTWTLLGTAVLTVAVIVLADPLAQLLLTTQSSGESGGALGAALLRIFAFQLPLYGLSVVLAAYLQARRRFLWPAMMPLLSSVTVMISYRVYAHLVP